MTVSSYYPSVRISAGVFRPSSRAGFSLVEVLLATALVTFAMLVIFSLIPAGLSSLQDTNRQIVETEIFNTVGAEMSSTPFASLDTYSANRFPRFLDNEGLEVAQAEDAAFTVRCVVTNSTGPGSGELRRATVSIGYRRDPNAPGAKTTKRSFLLANRGF